VIKQWPIVSVYLVLATGLAAAEWVDFRVGAVTVAGSVLWALLLRWRLSDAAAGMLRVRRRRVDLTVLSLLGAVMLVLALVVPHH
jgi:hypothetical protein